MVNVASRLQSAASGGDMVIDQATFDALASENRKLFGPKEIIHDKHGVPYDVFRTGFGNALAPLPATDYSRPSTSEISTISIDTTPLTSTPKVVPKGLRSFERQDADFFLELLPGPRDREGLPESLRFWKTHIEQRDAENTFSVGLIYGSSGCGKSSFVKAGLLPNLAPDVIPIYLEATADETETAILNRLRKGCPQLTATLDLRESLASLRRGVGIAPEKKVLLVIDQFEQWLHAHRDAANTDLVQALRQCDGIRVQCIVMVRDDFWMAATRFMRELEIRLLEGQNSLSIDLFDEDHAKKVLTAFGVAFARLPDNAGKLDKEQKEFLTQAISGLANEGRVICVRLALFAEMMKSRPWTPASLRDVGGTAGVGATFLEETFSAPGAPPEHRFYEKAARGVLKALLPEAAADIKGHMQSYSELLAASGCGNRRQDFEDLVRILDNELRLITPTDPDGTQTGDESTANRAGGERYYQLAHDYLVHSLRDWLTRKQKETRRGRAELLLADRAGVWQSRQESRQLPSLWQWFSILCLTRKAKWTRPERLMMRQSRRYYLLRGVMAGCALGLLGWGALEARGTFESDSLRKRLYGVNIRELPAVIQEMNPYRRWLDPILRDDYSLAETAKDGSKQVRAALALLPEDPTYVDYVYSQLLTADTQSLPVIREALASHRTELLARLWVVAGQRGKAFEQTRIRASAALASYDSQNSQWNVIRDQVADDLVVVPMVYAADWIEAFRPMHEDLLGPLAEIYRDHKRTETERYLATDILASYAEDQPKMLADLLMDADERQFRSLYPIFQREWQAGAAPLRYEIEQKIPPDASAEARDKEAKRQANAAIILLKVHDPFGTWALLKHSPDPSVRSYLIHRLGPLGIEPRLVMKRLTEETDVTSQCALVLSLGEFPDDAWTKDAREKMIHTLKELYRTSSDPGLHAAARWMLQKCRQSEWLRECDEAWAKDEQHRAHALADIARTKASAPLASARWYVNSQRQTMIALPGPVEFQMGSPSSEPDRVGGAAGKVEMPHRMHIGRTFALSATHVTVQQFLRFRADHHYNNTYSPTEDHPVSTITWYDAAAYCNWLSEQDGIPKEQWCYEPNSDGQFAKGMKIAPNYLRRSGYRLPTEAEWEYAARAGATTSRFYGDSESLLVQYAWYSRNSLSRVMSPVGNLKPNDFGFFDILGNIWNWCQEPYIEYANQIDQGRVDDQEFEVEMQTENKRVQRGGSFLTHGVFIRCAARYGEIPSHHVDNMGLRPSRTLP